LLRSAWKAVQGRCPFTVEAICLLPDHIHCIWTLPEGDCNYSLRWGEIKRVFSTSYREQVGPGADRNASRRQRRFWEHTLRDPTDLARHLDYIPYNPVKHGLVKSVADWPWSSFHRYVSMGVYELGWGAAVGQVFDAIGCQE